MWSEDLGYAEGELERKREGAKEDLRRSGGVVVALSGGVDSAVLLLLAVEALGPERVLAVSGHSDSLADADLQDAREVAGQLGARHRIVETREIDRPAYRANRGDRCFHCREELFSVLRRIADEEGLAAIAYGAIRDDLGDHRPGMEAAGKAGALAPLLAAGFTKEDVRAEARRAGLAVRDKPAAACLSSRIPPGIEVTPDRLRQVERAEAAVRTLGFATFRVRHHGEIGRIELDEAGLARLADPEVRRALGEAVRGAGFRFAAVELEPFRSGSLSGAGLLEIGEPSPIP